MNVQIVEMPFCVTLHGCQGPIDSRGVPVVGRELMDNMWRHVRQLGLKTTGINHWVYLDDHQMMTGVELMAAVPETVEDLKTIQVNHSRHLRFLHRGEYSKLAEVWPKLFDEIAKRELIPCLPHLEIYGHWNSDPEKCETTIVIGLN